MLPLALLLAVQIAPDNPAVPYRQPQLAVTKELAGVTFGGGNAVYFAGSRDQGKTFSKPVKVGEASALALGRHRGPRIAIDGNAIVISAVVAGRSGGAEGDLVAWRSTDGGRSWSPPLTLNEVPNSAREGLHAMAAGNGVTFAAWLDLRNRATQLFGARSSDGGATWSKNVLIYQSPDGHICECCHPSVTVDARGHVYAMWRNWLGGARDMYLARSTDGGLTFQKAEKLGHGTWPLNACPMDGGAIAVDSKGSVVSVWRRAKEVFLARPGQPETRLDEGIDAALALGPDGAYLAWSAGHGLRVKTPAKDQPAMLAEHGAFVHVAGSGPVLAAWETKAGIVIETLR
jgi:hypothetical protein